MLPCGALLLVTDPCARVLMVPCHPLAELVDEWAEASLLRKMRQERLAGATGCVAV